MYIRVSAILGFETRRMKCICNIYENLLLRTKTPIKSDYGVLLNLVDLV